MEPPAHPPRQGAPDDLALRSLRSRAAAEALLRKALVCRQAARALQTRVEAERLVRGLLRRRQGE